MVAKVDDEDYDSISQFKWYAQVIRGKVYAARNRSRKSPLGKRTIFLHRVISNASDGEMVDHIDGDGLNCCRNNLRNCTNSENLMNRGAPKNNTSGYKGVCWDKQDRVWTAKITLNQVQMNIGRYDDPIDAARAYDTKAREIFGEYAWTNFKE